MDPIEPDADRPWRPASSGPSFVYLLPCLGEDLAKLGMSRDPLDRAQTLHPRWFDFFDLDDGLLVETDSVREARAIERRVGRAWAAHSAPAPLTVSAQAGGHTEWYRGLAADLAGIATSERARGHVVHRPLRDWLHDALKQRGPLLFHWASAMLESIEADRAGRYAGADGRGWHPGPTLLERRLRDALDAFAVLGLPPERLIPDAVAAWWRTLPGRPDVR